MYCIVFHFWFKYKNVFDLSEILEGFFLDFHANSKFEIIVYGCVF